MSSSTESPLTTGQPLVQPCVQNDSISCFKTDHDKNDWTSDAYLIAAIVMFTLGGILFLIGLIRLIWWCTLPKNPKPEKDRPPPEYYFAVDGQGTLASRHSLHQSGMPPLSSVTTLGHQDDTNCPSTNQKKKKQYRYMIRYVESNPDGPYYVTYPSEYMSKLGPAPDYNGQQVLWY